MSQQPTPDLARPLALVLFSHQLSTMLDAGSPLLRALEVLREAPAPYGEAAGELRRRVGQGESMSRAMADRPDLFSPFYRVMVRAGEVGGILEETLHRTADLTTKEWKLVRGCPGKVEPVFLINPVGTPLFNDWTALSNYQRTVLLALFCETFGLLLVSGVPILQAMRTLAELLPSVQNAGLLSACEAVARGERVVAALEQLGILPRFALELIAIGEEGGHLDGALERAADIFQHELECRLLVES